MDINLKYKFVVKEWHKILILIAIVLLLIAFGVVFINNQANAQWAKDADPKFEQPVDNEPPAPPGKPFVTEVKLGQPSGPIVVTPIPPAEEKEQPEQKEIKAD